MKVEFRYLELNKAQAGLLGEKITPLDGAVRQGAVIAKAFQSIKPETAGTVLYNASTIWQFCTFVSVTFLYPFSLN